MESQIRKILIALSVKYKGDWVAIRTAIAQKEKITQDEINNYFSQVKTNCLVLTDDDFPECFKRSFRPPFVLYYKGDIKLLSSDRKRMAVVGTRNPTANGEKGIKKILNDLLQEKQDIVVVSGMAKGIDSIAQRVFIENKGKVISVLGSGIEVCYPEVNKDIYDYCSGENGLVVSEYPDLVPPMAEHFPSRNRLIACLGQMVLIGEGKENSGTQITVNCALEDGKPIYCIPTDVLSEMNLCNILIRDGAYPCISSQDIIDSFNHSHCW